MTRDEVDALLATLQAAYPYVVVDQDTKNLWTRAMATSDPDDMFDAAEWWIPHESRFPTIAELNQALRERRMPVVIRASHCDGSGFLQSHPDHPCPVCNPATAEMFADPVMKRRWRNGEPTYQILGMRRAEYVEHYSRPRCLPEQHREDPDDSVVTEPARAYEIASRNYIAECHDQGREPNMEYFDEMFAAFVKHVESAGNA